MRPRHQQLERSMGIEPDIAQLLGSNGLHHLADSPGKHLAADIAGLPMPPGFERQMLAAAIADLDDDPVRLRKQHPWIKHAIERDLEVGQRGVKHGLLPVMQPFAGPTPKKSPRLARTRLGKLVVWLGQNQSALLD